MKDLYKQLGLEDSSGEAAICAALPGAAPDVRGAAEFILLDPSRRKVYDRNRRVLVTVGRLRAHLGLNLTQFWPRPRFADFTIDLTPAAAPAGAAARPTDPLRMAWAFGVKVRSAVPPHRSRHVTITVAVLALAIVVLFAVWYWTR